MDPRKKQKHHPHDIYTEESVRVLDQFIRQLAERLATGDSYDACAALVGEFIGEHCGEGPAEGNFFKGGKTDDTLEHETGLAWDINFPLYPDWVKGLMGEPARIALVALLTELPGFVFWDKTRHSRQELRGRTLEHCRAFLERRGIQWTDAGKLADDVAHSPGFRSVRWYGDAYSFTTNQAPAIRLLYENSLAGTPDVGDEALLMAVDSEAPPARLSTLFRDHPAWGTIIVAGGSRGTHRLVKPAEKNL